jgi:hypothetical protein
MKVSLDIAALLAALAWPAVLAFVLLKYRGPLERLLRSDTINVQIPWGGISLQFATVKPMSQDPFAAEFRHPTSSTQIMDSVSGAFAMQLEDETPATYAVVDLGQGQEWLTSRLYIFALLLHRMRGVRVFVFVQGHATRRRFVGFAETSRIRWALAQRFPWLEEAFAYAYGNTIDGVNSNSSDPLSPTPTKFRIVSREGKLARPSGNPAGFGHPATEVFVAFLGRIQKSAQPQPAPIEEWIPISNPPGSEHARWLDVPMVEELLGKDLVTTSVQGSVRGSV